MSIITAHDVSPLILIITGDYGRLIYLLLPIEQGTGKKESIPQCLINLDILEVNSLQEHYWSFFIKDYYVEMDFD